MGKRLKINNEQYIVPTGTQTDCINLVINQNYNQHHPSVLSKTEYIINNYPYVDTKYKSLQKEICAYINHDKREDVKDIQEDNILITPGSENGLYLINQIFTHRQTKVLVPFPNYPGFTHKVKMFTENITYFPFHGKMDEYSRFYETIPNHDIVYISSPNLPLGYEINESITNIIKEHKNILFIIDEAYFEYGIQKSFVDPNLDNLIISRTFSKAFALAGARIGYLISHSSTINTLKIGHSIKDVLEVSVDLALSVLQHQDFYLNQIKQDKENWKRFLVSIRSIICKGDIIYDYQHGNAPYFILFTEHPEYVCNLFKKHGYLVRDKTTDLGKGCIRVTLSLKPYLNDIYNIIKMINGYYKKYEIVYMDIDNTIRENRNSMPIKGLSPLIHRLKETSKVVFITNNVSKYDRIEAMLRRSNIPYDDLITPFKNMELSFKEYQRGYCIRGSKLYITKFPNITYELMEHIYLHKKIYIVEESKYELSTEIGNYDNEITIPFIGVFKSIIDSIYPNKEITYTVIGKSELKLHHEEKKIMMIGDGDSDFEFAKNNVICFKKVINPEDTLQVIHNILK